MRKFVVSYYSLGRSKASGVKIIFIKVEQSSVTDWGGRGREGKEEGLGKQKH